MSEVLNRGVFGLSEDRVVLVRLRTQSSLIGSGNNRFSGHFASSVHRGVRRPLSAFEYFILRVSLEVHGRVLFG
jgi:hypothetical protein